MPSKRPGTSDHELPELLANVRALRAEMRGLRLAVEGRTYRDQLIAELAAAVGLGPTWSCAQEIALILGGVRVGPAPELAAALRASRSCPRSPRQILRILQSVREEEFADTTAVLCQWPPRAEDHAHTADEGIDDER